MKATLDFELPREEFHFTRAVNGLKWSQIVYDVDHTLRQWIKHDDSLTNEQRECYEKIKRMIHNEMLDHQLTFEG